MKIAKVIFQESREANKTWGTEHRGITSCCGELVFRNQYGRDENCPECGAELDWSEE